jgi:pilus assembly protein Flp/PilA
MRRMTSERGASLVEYALLIALIAVVCIGAIRYFGAGSSNSVDHSTSEIIGAG